ncbi:MULTISPECIES: tetraprenyl-beta-curcumene synthase family protein [Sutcliffiella]|uniref:Tetraprenyl-beta-curcumene synthase n=1 Tax=Sutcliffiella cohnii TaxID=33932 RepID=A0A223KTX2_9BACI|nr:MULTISPECIES: tetraprenyl-beta-curcumene synthase family protein [Sutcliffiella]AST92942.1 tetraprenyl-beta-curcumene synthase [Sutcliffiella cohnii]WBL14205.1 tetraprenyl-beta-curcumene synthase family protein [Sutcliffiella sp. NC1]
MKIPTHPISLMKRVYRDVFPIVYRELSYWKARAEKIPNDELRTQALASIETKTFHCEGGAILSLLSEDELEKCIKFIVAYQTISDYLDNLCDRSTSLDPIDFRALHDAMPDALTVGAPIKNYYAYREDQEDGGYLADLVLACQSVLKENKHYASIRQELLQLANYYCDLQVHKHVAEEERVPRLQKWFTENKSTLPEMEWYEFSACSGSTLGIFCLVSSSFHQSFQLEHGKRIVKGYFPYIQGLHILLDYFIDQEEDQLGGDLNFCFYYPDETKLLERLQHFLEKADEFTAGLPNEKFHRLINRGLLGVYLSDRKVAERKEVSTLAKKIIRSSGGTAFFFYVNGRAYRTIQKWRKSS